MKVLKSAAMIALTAAQLAFAGMAHASEGIQLSGSGRSAAASDPAALALSPAVPQTFRLPEGTEVNLTLDEALSSHTAAVGDTFVITVSQPITLADGTVIPAGYRGRGEVVNVEQRGMLGKAGQLGVRLSYFMVGGTKVYLRANRNQDGKSKQTTTIVLSLLVTPLFLLMKGKDATIPRGQEIRGFVDAPVELGTPLAAPPT